MPIPEFSSELPKPTQLVLVPAIAARPQVKTPRVWVARLLAHAIDAAVVSALGTYAGQLLTLGLISFYNGAFKDSARESSGLFRDLFNYGEASLSAAGIAMFGFLLLVALPCLTKLTPGLGVIGLRVESEEGDFPSSRGMVRRLLITLFYYASFGSLLLLSVRGRDGKALQDRISHTRIVRND
jgi:uncharacterized RDD family membrane protein YckC